MKKKTMLLMAFVGILVIMLVGFNACSSSKGVVGPHSEIRIKINDLGEFFQYQYWSYAEKTWSEKRSWQGDLFTGPTVNKGDYFKFRIYAGQSGVAYDVIDYRPNWNQSDILETGFVNPNTFKEINLLIE